MKTILIIIAAFGVQLSTLTANNIGDIVTSKSPGGFICPECPVLIPEVPAEASFGEIVEFTNETNLNPVVPMEASFDYEAESVQTVTCLSPVMPVVADFDDTMLMEDHSDLAPVAPVTAGFSDTL